MYRHLLHYNGKYVLCSCILCAFKILSHDVLAIHFYCFQEFHQYVSCASPCSYLTGSLVGTLATLFSNLKIVGNNFLRANLNSPPESPLKKQSYTNTEIGLFLLFLGWKILLFWHINIETVSGGST